MLNTDYWSSPNTFEEYWNFRVEYPALQIYTGHHFKPCQKWTVFI